MGAGLDSPATAAVRWRSTGAWRRPLNDNAPVLSLDGLVVGYQGRPLLPPLSTAVRPGELWALIGRNGSGKSTLLRTLLGLLAPVGGRMAWARRARVAFVPQRGEHEPAMPARAIDMVRSGVDRGWSFVDPFFVARHREAIRAALEETGATALADEPFATLSEGQKQRVWLARALASGPDVILLDEPTSALDAVAEREAFELLDDLRRERGLAFVMASHHMAYIPRFATHAVLVDRDDGVALAGPIGDVLASATYKKHYASDGEA
ncbi:MAG: ATP-binding cassette domain-containing protein [Deltaproteobacteria bacterium]|nr:MAG: ATP-binding cassette domain-containing protein [Deltaproteobacteria bacterium]